MQRLPHLLGSLLGLALLVFVPARAQAALFGDYALALGGTFGYYYAQGFELGGTTSNYSDYFLRLLPRASGVSLLPLPFVSRYSSESLAYTEAGLRIGFLSVRNRGDDTSILDFGYQVGRARVEANHIIDDSSLPYQRREFEFEEQTVTSQGIHAETISLGRHWGFVFQLSQRLVPVTGQSTLTSYLGNFTDRLTKETTETFLQTRIALGIIYAL